MNIKELIKKANKYGIPVPTCRDPRTGQGSASFTLLVISGGVVLLGLLNSFAKIFKGVDIEHALYWFGMCTALYWGRSFKKDGDSIEIGSNESKDES